MSIFRGGDATATSDVVDFEVQVAARGASAGADQTEDLAGGNLLSDNDVRLGEHVAVPVDDACGEYLGEPSAPGHGW